jgi:20S proteasome alpha/beta subunit
MNVGVVAFFVCMVGSAELNQPVSVKTAAALFQQICYDNKDRLMAGIIVAGWDPVEKGGSIYSIPLGGTPQCNQTLFWCMCVRVGERVCEYVAFSDLQCAMCG